jgi:antitoxin PrlF
MTDDVAGTKIAERLMTRPDGATMDEMVAATGGPQYNVLRRLEGRGYRIRKVKEGKATRYFAAPPAKSSYGGTVTSKGQMTIPKEVREHLRLRAGGKVRFELGSDASVVMKPVEHSIRDMFGMLGKPPRSLTLEEMDEVIRQAAVDRYLRAVGRKKR